MAGAVASTTTTPLVNLTRPPRSKLRHFSANNVPSLHHQPFPSTSRLYYNHRSILTISNCHGKLNSSSRGETYEVDEGIFGGYDGIDEESDEDESESSVDLLIRFLQSMFRKVSKRAKKASRSVLPAVISPQLVSFAVDGTLLLASLSVVKALLEVICTIGGAVFAAVLILRVMWAAVSYFQSSGNSFNQGGSSFGAVA